MKGDISRADMVVEALGKTDINWIWPLDILKEGKKTQRVCNVEYDAGHWNENGAMLVYEYLYERIKRIYPQVELLSRDEFTVSMEQVNSLPVSRFRIDEQIPIYTLKNSVAIRDDAAVSDQLFCPVAEDYSHWINPEQEGKPKLLVFHDSYMATGQKFFTEHFSEVTFIHRVNVVNQEVFEKYIEVLNPDLIIFENCERVLPITFDGEYAF